MAGGGKRGRSQGGGVGHWMRGWQAATGGQRVQDAAPCYARLERMTVALPQGWTMTSFPA
jgi:hypothetical protein